MMGIKERAFAPLPAVTLDDLVPADHFYRHLERTLDLTFVRDLVRHCYAAGGRPSVDPVVFFKLQLIMFFEGRRSERQLMAVVADRLSLRWYLGYDLGERLPDHSSLTKIRERYGLDIFQRFFERVVERCQAAGLVWGEELLFDATKGRANADVDSLVPRFYWQAKRHLDDLFTPAPDAAEHGETARQATGVAPDAPEANGGGPPVPLPIRLLPEQEQALAAENDGRWRLLEHRRLDPARPATGGRTRLGDVKVSTTDPDAAPMQQGHASVLGYQDHYVVDGGKARIILHALVTPADVMENTPLPDLLWRVRFRWKLHPKRAVGDTTYGTGENLRLLEEAGIRAYMPVADHEQSSPFFRQRDFIFDPERDVYTCPQGATLHYRGNNYTTRVRIYQAPAAACRDCPLRFHCTESAEGRKLNRHFDEEYRERARRYRDTPAYARALRKRQVWVEPLFGEAKEWHGLRRFRLRGLEKVNIEAVLTAAGQNLKRLVSWRGWGQRPWPGGAAGLRLVPQRTGAAP